ncbi:TPA: YdgA family protein [Escherichia coli]
MIRKSATGVIVALAVIWGGGTWYTGTQIQPGVEKFIKDFNDAKKKGEHAYDMTLSYKNFDKGFFNSRFQMQMTFDNGAPDLNIKPGQKVVFDVDVEHGPLPITMLMHGNVIPALAAAKVNLVNNELTQPLFIAAKNKSPVEATLRFAFGGSFSTTLDVAPAEYGKFSFGEGQFTFNGDGSSLSNLDIEGKVEDIVLQLSPMNKVTAKSFTIDSLARLEEKKFPVGESESKFNQINIINHGEDVAQIDAFVAKTMLDRVKDKDYINVNLTYELDKLTKGNQQLGSGEWSLIAESIDPSAVRQFIIQYNIAMQKQLAAHPELANDEVALQEVNAALFKEYLPLLQKSEPTIKQPVKWKNALGELNANLDISIADPAKSSSSTNKDIKSLNFDVKLPLNVVTETAKQLNLSEGIDAEKAQKRADKQISGMMTLGQMFQLITIDNNTASLQLRYTPGKVVFNGQEMSEEEFMSRAGRFVH